MTILQYWHGNLESSSRLTRLWLSHHTCAASAKADNQGFMRSVLVKTFSDFIDMQDIMVQEATQAGLHYLTRRVYGRDDVTAIK